MPSMPIFLHPYNKLTLYNLQVALTLDSNTWKYDDMKVLSTTKKTPYQMIILNIVSTE